MEAIILYDYIIIGAGIIGSSTAYTVSQEFGNKTLLLEQFDFLNKVGSSHGESRIIRKTYSQEHYSALMLDCYKKWDEVQEKSKMKVITTTGGIDIGQNDTLAIQNIIRLAEKFGNPFSILTPANISEKFPTIHLPPDKIAVYSPEAGIINPIKAMSMYQSLARENGAVLKDRAKVTQIIEPSGDEEFTTVHMENGEIFKGKKIIVTAGPWTNKLLNGSNLINESLPLKTKQGTVGFFKVEDSEAYDYKKFPIYINYEVPFVYGFPSFEYPGLIKCAGHGGQYFDPDERDYVPAQFTITNGSKPFLEKFFLGVNTSAPIMTETCMMTDTPDEDYILDKLTDNIVIGAGFSGHGFKLAPIVGQILSELAIHGNHSYPEYEKYFSIKRFENSVSTTTTTTTSTSTTT